MIDNGKDKLEWERKVDSSAVNSIRYIRIILRHFPCTPLFIVEIHSMPFLTTLLLSLESSFIRSTKYLMTPIKTFQGVKSRYVQKQRSVDRSWTAFRTH